MVYDCFKHIKININSISGNPTCYSCDHHDAIVNDTGPTSAHPPGAPQKLVDGNDGNDRRRFVQAARPMLPVSKML